MRATYEMRYDSVELDRYYKFEPDECSCYEDDCYEDDHADYLCSAARDDAWEYEMEHMG